MPSHVSLPHSLCCILYAQSEPRPTYSVSVSLLLLNELLLLRMHRQAGVVVRLCTPRNHPSFIILLLICRIVQISSTHPASKLPNIVLRIDVTKRLVSAWVQLYQCASMHRFLSLVYSSRRGICIYGAYAPNHRRAQSTKYSYFSTLYTLMYSCVCIL